jgi:uncharacterized protein with von Willebrand factor type A (vWA) domain
MKDKNFLSRSQLTAQAVSGADDFTALRYLRLRKDAPKIPEVETKGAQTLPNIQSAMFDIYGSLWSLDPTVKSQEEVGPNLQYWRQMLESTVNTSAFKQMHALTQLKELESLVGAITMGEQVLTMVPEEDKEKLQELAEQQSQVEDAEAQLGQAQGDAEAAANLMAQLQQAMGSGQPSAQAQATMQEVQDQMQQAQEQAQQAQMTLEQAQARAQQIAEQLMGKPGSADANAKQTQLKRIAQAAATAANAEIKEVSNLLQSWGVDPAELSQGSAAQALEVVKRMKQSEAFKKFKDLLGRLRHIAARKAKSNAMREGRFVPKTEYGRDITRAQTDQLVALVHPALRYKGLQSWMRGELRLKGRKFKRALGKGPVVVCEDASGSMDGTKQQWAKAVILALAYYAKLKHRTFVWIMYDSSVRKTKVYINGNLTADDMLEIAESRAGGGTNFEAPLAKALEIIQKEGLQKADICFITDGICAVPEKFLAEFVTTKRKMEVNVITVLMDIGDTSDATIRGFSDTVHTVSSFTAEEAGQKVIANLV